MRFGVCCSLGRAKAVLDVGFDYVELPAGQLFAPAAEPDLDSLQNLKVEATNLFVEGDLMLVGPDKGDVRGYAERVVSRAAKAGVQVMVIGSGAARRSPAGYDLDAAEDDFYRSVAICAEIGRAHGVEIAPESLRPEETNVGNYMGDLARMLQFKAIGYTADVFHILSQPGAWPESEEYWRSELPHAPIHVHLSDSSRGWRVAEDAALVGFVARLRELDYSGRVSLECGWSDWEAELPLALEELRVVMGRGA